MWQRVVITEFVLLPLGLLAEAKQIKKKIELNTLTPEYETGLPPQNSDMHLHIIH